MRKIITLTALMSAFFSLTYAIWQKRTANNKIRDILIKTRRVSTQDIFMHPTEESLKKFTGNSCICIANQINTNSYSDDDFGNLSRECAVFILKSLAKNMPKNETLSDYFSRKKTEN